MLRPYPADERGRTRIDWLDSRHSFSFGDYHDPSRMGFRALRVINEDRVEPGRGFEPHSHRDMEILSYVLGGALEHRDSLGNGSRIRPGDLQRMSAGTGITHSEYNPSATEPVHFLQIWVLPERAGLAPSYEQRHFAPELRRGALRLLASPGGLEGSVRIHQDVRIYGALLEAGERVSLPLAAGRHGWLQLARGRIALRGTSLGAGDGAALSDEPIIELVAEEPSEVLAFDLA
jgi:redox-sensitive bicupin YhaK (pirin superfamily)